MQPDEFMDTHSRKLLLTIGAIVLLVIGLNLYIGAFPNLVSFGRIYNRANELFFDNQLQGANEQYTLALKRAPDDASKAKAYYGIGNTLMGMERFEEALNAFNEAIKLDSKLIVAYQNKASVYRKMGQYALSVNACKETIARFPDFAQAYSTMGLAYEKMEDYESALPVYVRAIKLNPDRYYPRDRLYYCLTQVSAESQQRNLAELTWVDQALAANLQTDLAEDVSAGSNQFDVLNQGLGLYQPDYLGRVTEEEGDSPETDADEIWWKGIFSREVTV